MWQLNNDGGQLEPSRYPVPHEWSAIAHGTLLAAVHVDVDIVDPDNEICSGPPDTPG